MWYYTFKCCEFSINNVCSSMAKDKRYNSLSILIFSLMGCFLAANQGIVTNVTEALGGTEAQMGYMISALYVGNILAVPFVGELAVAFGKRIAAFLCSLTVCVGALLVLLCQSVPVAVLGYAVYGAGIGGYESINMSLVADNRQQDANQFLNFLQALFSVGAMAAPLIVARFLRGDQFRPLYVVLLVSYLLLALYFLLDRRIDAFATKDKKANHGLSFLKLIKNRKMLLYMAAMFIYLGAETALTYWVSSLYAQSGIGQYGAMALSAYWFASIFGRLLGSRVKSPKSIIVPCFAVAALGYFMVAFVDGVIVKTLAIIIVGIAFAPVYAGIALIGGNLFPENSAPAFSLMIFAAGMGGVFFQPLISLFLSSGNFAAAYWITGALCGMTALVLAVSIHRETAVSH